MKIELIYGAYVAILVFGGLAYGDAIVDRIANLRETSADFDFDPRG